MLGSHRLMQCMNFHILLPFSAPQPILYQRSNSQLSVRPFSSRILRSAPLSYLRLGTSPTGVVQFIARRSDLAAAATLTAGPAVAVNSSILAASPAAADAMASSASEGGAGALWATCLVLFAGALLTGLPPLCWWESSTAGKATQTTGLAALLQGPSLRLLSAGLMLGSGLGVVLPEGFHAFAEGSPGAGSGWPEWVAGAGLLAGFVGMLALQLWLEGSTQSHSHMHDGATVAITAVAGQSRGGDGAVAPSDGTGGQPHGDDPDGREFGRSHTGWRRRWDGGYSALPSAVAADAEVPGTRGPSGSSAAATVVAGGPGSMELTRRHGPPAAAGAAASTAHVSYTLTTESAVGTPTCSACPSSSSPRDAVGSGDGFVATAASSSSAAIPAAITAPAAERVSSAQLALSGLLIHSAADGLAIGAASLGGSGGGGGPSALSVTVAAAIMMHKLPVTLGLTTFLRAGGWRRTAVLQALLAFSASAPLAALAAYYLLSFLLLYGTSSGGNDTDGSGISGQVVALAILFSGGTFLAAATQHILPAALATVVAPPLRSGGGGGSKDLEGNGAAAAAASSSQKDMGGGGGIHSSSGSGLPLLCLAVGSLLPLLIAALLPEP